MIILLSRMGCCSSTSSRSSSSSSHSSPSPNPHASSVDRLNSYKTSPDDGTEKQENEQNEKPLDDDTTGLVFSSEPAAILAPPVSQENEVESDEDDNPLARAMAASVADHEQKRKETGGTIELTVED
jgi:hypothetical protein